jgi:hypothetical protein
MRVGDLEHCGHFELGAHSVYARSLDRLSDNHAEAGAMP